MKRQNFKNHSKFVIGYHLVTFLAIVALIIGSIINLINSSKENLYSASLLVLVSFILLLSVYFLRSFALRAQDRVIRIEENFRHYLLKGKPLSDKLTVRQIIGLRFASDEEFSALADKAVKEKLSEKEIKQQIKSWKADLYRV
jgi:membrane-bound ClpP family serine protease